MTEDSLGEPEPATSGTSAPVGPRPRSARRRRTPRLAEVVADSLREQILSGELSDGSELPNQERLLDEYGVSKQAVREGLRILELEGLITVRRGNVGGAVVHSPTNRGAAYGLGLVLQSRGVQLSELERALAVMEPMAARLCAARPDRDRTVMPLLQAAQEASTRALADAGRFTAAMSDFHSAMIAGCGIEPVAVVFGAVEELWLAHVRAWGTQRIRAGAFPDLAYRQAGVDAHGQLMALIARGDEKGAAAFAATHFTPQQFYTDGIRPDQPVLVSALDRAEEEGRQPPLR